MRFRLCAAGAVCLAVTAALGIAVCGASQKAPSASSTRIFNGVNLRGWEVMGRNKAAFYVKDAVMECNGKGGDWIRYTRQVDDFVLRLKYRISPGGNSGVFIRSAREGDPPYTGWEVQILDSSGRDPGKHTAGAIYDVITPMREMSRPAGEWNDLVIFANGPFAKVELNGFKIIDVDFRKLDKPIGKFKTAYKDLPRKGYIGFQDHGNVVAFKDITLTPLARQQARK